MTGVDSAKIQADTAAAVALRGNAAALFKAGIPIALTSYGLDRPRDFRDRIIASITAGLPADEALRALTVTPARALGLDRVLGTIETGKLANLVVTNGDLFSRSTRIDRKSTRLNSSHRVSSYAVFCLKKKLNH